MGMSAHSWAFFRAAVPWRKKRTWKWRANVTLNVFGCVTLMLFAIRWAAKSNSTRGSLILVIARTVIIWLRTVSALSKSLALMYWKTTFRRRRARKTLSA